MISSPVVVLLAFVALSTSAPTTERPAPVPLEDPSSVLTSSTTSRRVAARSAAGLDSFDLYGGPSDRVRDPNGIPGDGDEYVEGKFQDPSGFLPRGLSTSEGDWTGEDLTEEPVFWHVDSFNAENLGGNGPGNRAMWCGVAADDPLAAGWDAAPGYGDNWNEVLLYESGPVADPSVGQTVGLDFVFNLYTEPGYDFFSVDYDSAGTWVEVYSISGTNAVTTPVVDVNDFPAGGTQFSTVGANPIFYPADGYVQIDDGLGGTVDGVRIRLQFAADGAFSMEDGLFSGPGAVQVDDIELTTSQGTLTEDFEGEGPYLFEPQKQPFFGDFSNVFAQATDIDPCRSNGTPQVNFIDSGQAPPNGPGVTGIVSTGGSTNPLVDYGVPGSYVVNTTSGISGSYVAINNLVWSPPIDWDVPGPADDGSDVLGAVLSFDVWRDNPLAAGVFYVWSVRARVDGVWGELLDRNFIYFSSRGEYLRQTEDLTDLLPPDPEQIQIALGVVELSNLHFYVEPTPAPWFDNVRLTKYRIGGIQLVANERNLANDAFPASGTIDASTAVARDALDVRFDGAVDIGTGDGIVTADSVLVDARPLIPGTSIQTLRMKWALRVNPLFEPALRSAPARPEDVDVDTTGDVWTGAVDMELAFDFEAPRADVYAADLPDADFLYPGDVLHYHFEAVDSDGRVTTLPADVSGFGQWDANGRSAYDRTYTVRALPSLGGSAGEEQPSVLVVNAARRTDNEAELESMFSQLGFVEGRDWDRFTVQAATSRLENGIGSAAMPTPLGDRRGHGASDAQLLGYSTIVFLSGDRSDAVLGDGSGGLPNDKSDDVGRLTNWKSAPGPRNTIHFGNFLAASLDQGSVAKQDYLASVMGVVHVGVDAGSELNGTTTPFVVPTDPGVFFTEEFFAFGGCPRIGEFDSIRPDVDAVATHAFVEPGGTPDASSPAGAVVFDRLVEGDRKVDMTFPFGLGAAWEGLGRAAQGASLRTRLFEAVLDYLGEEPTGPPVVTSAPDARRAAVDVWPNPFNPRLNVRFALPAAGVDARVTVFDLRGQQIATLHDGPAANTTLELVWDGRDAAGARVASGVYLVLAATEGFEQSRKAILLK